MATAPQITALPSFVAAKREVRKLREQGRKADVALAQLADDLADLGIRLEVSDDNEGAS